MLAALAHGHSGEEVTMSAGLESSGSEQWEEEKPSAGKPGCLPTGPRPLKRPHGTHREHPGRRLWKPLRTAWGEAGCVHCQGLVFRDKVDMAVGTQPSEVLGQDPVFQSAPVMPSTSAPAFKEVW